MMLAKWNLMPFTFFYRNFLIKPVSGIISSLLLITFVSPAFADNDNLLNKIHQLDSEFQELSEEFYQQNAIKGSGAKPNIDDLSIKIDTLSKDKLSTKIIDLIYSNIDTVRNNVDHPSIFPIIEVLLNQRETNLANSLFQDIKDGGDDFQLATIKFLFSKYHAQQFEWSKVNNLLKGITENLSEEHSAYALLLRGNALQHLKKHRQAETVYNNISESSEYYGPAQLNIAIAQIRQGWLTSATKTINNLIQQENSQINDEFTNRLYLVLGYAFLQKDYFRNSRDVFRKISQTSKYTNRALLGIALCAVNQKDFQGALNTLAILKAKDIDDISVDESYLLTTYVYEKLQQDEHVVSSSTEAMNYYQKRIVNLLDFEQQHINFNQIKFDKNSPVISIRNYRLEYVKNLPVFFLNNYQHLIYFSEINKSPELANKIALLINKFDETFQLIIKQIISTKVSYLKSYLNQARYGLARLYDNNEQEAQ